MRLIFWVKLYLEESDFIFLIIADVIHLIMVSGFIYSFIKNLNTLSLPVMDQPKQEKKIF
jgi:hypothetical protein